ncbi:MAG: prolipoprotein diacylglyceryl transferase [Gammaproteobacteria bacterium]|nr:prolipoprotein diacylglyceryl transferase [Gammaproteobacteria bacterium]
MIINTNPVAFHLGDFAIHWYSIFFSTALIIIFYLMEWFFTREKLEHEFTCFLPFGFLGAILGARLGHFLFYAPDMLIENPMVLLLFNQEKGMASHGAFLGLMIAFYLCPKKCKSLSFLWLYERAAIALLFGGIFIRCGNFFNQEILGKPSDSWLAVSYSQMDNIARHPVQLYESAAYTIMAFIFMHLYIKKEQAPGTLLWQILVCMSVGRFSLEFFKEYQTHLLLIAPFTNGQLLSIVSFIIGLLVYYVVKKKASGQ